MGTKFKVSDKMSVFAKDWDGTGSKIKIRLPTEDGKKEEFIIEPGEILEVEDLRMKKALENYVPPPIFINGEPWVARNKLFMEEKSSRVKGRILGKKKNIKNLDKKVRGV